MKNQNASTSLLFNDYKVSIIGCFAKDRLGIYVRWRLRDDHDEYVGQAYIGPNGCFYLIEEWGEREMS